MSPDETIALTYGALGQRLGIATASAKARAARNRWQRRIGNDGRAVVLVPIEALPSEPAMPREQPPQPPAATEEPSEAILEGRIARLEQRHAAELERLERLRVEAMAQLRQDHAAEMERMTAAHQSDAARLERIIQQLNRPWWTKIFK